MNEYVTSWHCTDNYVVGVLTSSDCFAVATTTSSSLVASSSPVITYLDFIFPIGIIIFFLAFIFSGVVLSLLGKRSMKWS